MNMNSMYLAINGNGEVPLIPFWILFIGIAIYAFKDPISYHSKRSFDKLKK